MVPATKAAMIFEPCPSGDCRGKLMVYDEPVEETASGPEAAPSGRAYCPLCRQSFERAAGETRWQLAGAQLA